MLAGAFCVCTTGGVGAEPLDIGSRLELFVDHYLIDEMNGVELELQEPRPANVAVRADKPWDGAFNFGGATLKVGNLYRMYYRGLPEGGESVWCVAESLDGIHWIKPNLGLTEVQGTMNNNIVATVDGKRLSVAPGINKPGAPESEKYIGITTDGKSAMWVWVSEDGLAWRKKFEEPVFETDLFNAFDSYNIILWSPSEKKYVVYLRYSVRGEMLGDDIIPGVRSIARTTSTDLKNWTEPVKMTIGDAGIKPPENLYTNSTIPYFRAPHLLVAFPARFMPGRRVITDEQLETLDMAESGVHRYYVDSSDGAFMTSRGGNHFDRTFMDVFVRPGPGAANWGSRTNYPFQGVWPTGPNEMSLYVNRHYAQPSWHVRRYTLRTDGFAAVHAPYEGGELITKPFTFEGNHLVLNMRTSAPGSIFVEIQDADGDPIDGYTLDDCNEIIGDEIARTVTWNDEPDVSDLAGKPIRLRFVMKDADLFSLRFQE